MTVSGSNWNEANEKATECLKQDSKAAFVHPYDQETTWQGHSTIVDEIKEQLESQGLCVLGMANSKVKSSQYVILFRV